MKNLSKVFALALLLAPGAVQAEQWCDGNNEHVWRYKTGLMPDNYNPDNANLQTLQQVSDYISAACELAWDQLGLDTASFIASPGFHFAIYSAGDPLEWRYRCLACRNGYPYLDPRPEVVGPAVVGGIVTELVAGKVVSIVLHGAGGDRPYYLVDVLSKSELVQVEVDATSGRAELVKEEEGGGICRQ